MYRHYIYRERETIYIDTYKIIYTDRDITSKSSELENKLLATSVSYKAWGHTQTANFFQEINCPLLIKSSGITSFIKDIFHKTLNKKNWWEIWQSPVAVSFAFQQHSWKGGLTDSPHPSGAEPGAVPCNDTSQLTQRLEQIYATFQLCS